MVLERTRRRFKKYVDEKSVGLDSGKKPESTGLSRLRRNRREVYERLRGDVLGEAMDKLDSQYILNGLGPHGEEVRKNLSKALEKAFDHNLKLFVKKSLKEYGKINDSSENEDGAYNQIKGYLIGELESIPENHLRDEYSEGINYGKKVADLMRSLGGENHEEAHKGLTSFLSEHVKNLDRALLGNDFERVPMILYENGLKPEQVHSAFHLMDAGVSAKDAYRAVKGLEQNDNVPDEVSNALKSFQHSKSIANAVLNYSLRPEDRMKANVINAHYTMASAVLRAMGDELGTPEQRRQAAQNLERIFKKTTGEVGLEPTNVLGKLKEIFYDRPDLVDNIPPEMIKDIEESAQISKDLNEEKESKKKAKDSIRGRFSQDDSLEARKGVIEGRFGIKSAGKIIAAGGFIAAIASLFLLFL